MRDKDIEHEMETVSSKLDSCEKRRLSDNEAYFWKQMIYVVAGVAVMCIGVLLLERAV